MSDADARFARRLGFRVGRWDWWNLWKEHTPYEWALQKLADLVEPLGEERADMRDARNTTRMILAWAPEASQSDLESEAESLRNYLAVNQPQDETLLPEQAEELKKRRANV